MRRIFTLIIALTACLAPALAQNNWDRIGIGAGVGYSPKADAVLFWEHETSYHNAWEVFLAGSLALDNLKGSLWDNGKAWGAGAAWKPCVVRSRPVWSVPGTTTGPSGWPPCLAPLRENSALRSLRDTSTAGYSGADGSSTGRAAWR